jgi:hypothetical protein
LNGRAGKVSALAHSSGSGIWASFWKIAGAAAVQAKGLEALLRALVYLSLPQTRSEWPLGANWAMLRAMADMLKLIWWAVVGLFGSISPNDGENISGTHLFRKFPFAVFLPDLFAVGRQRLQPGTLRQGGQQADAMSIRNRARLSVARVLASTHCVMPVI